MGDEADGLLRCGPELQQLFVEVVADDFVQRAEGLVHQQQIGIEGERTGNRGALLHAAGELPGEFLAEAGEVDEVEGAGDAGLLLVARIAHDLQRQRDVLLDGAPGIKRGGLEDIAVGAVLAGVLRRRAIDRDGAGGRLFEIGDDAQEGGLAAAGGADEGDEVALFDLQIDAGQRMHRSVAGVEGEPEIAGGDDGGVGRRHAQRLS